jgi:hypothetical protein
LSWLATPRRKVSADAFRAAMGRLFTAGKIMIVETGPASKRRRHIERAASLTFHRRCSIHHTPVARRRSRGDRDSVWEVTGGAEASDCGWQEKSRRQYKPPAKFAREGDIKLSLWRLRLP